MESPSVRQPNSNPIILPTELARRSIGPDAPNSRKSPDIFDRPKAPRDPLGARSLPQRQPSLAKRAFAGTLRWLVDRFCEVEVTGKPYDGGGHVISSSHEGLLDGIVMTGLDPRIKAVASPPVVNAADPIFRSTMHMIEKGEKYFEAVRNPRQGLVTWIAQDGCMHTNIPAGARSGAVRIANAARVPVQVVAITGTANAHQTLLNNLKKNWFRPWRWEKPKITVDYGGIYWPFEEDVVDGEYVRTTKDFAAGTKKLHEELSRLLKKQGYEGLPPERGIGGIFTAGRLYDPYMYYREGARTALEKLIKDLDANPRPESVILANLPGPIERNEDPPPADRAVDVNRLGWIKGKA
ncbi:MAG: hypothetical protein AAFQ82_18290 [Myxococcota bacterium]